MYGKSIGTLILCAFFLAATASALEYTWTGAADNDWSNSANWAEGAIPAVNPSGEVFNAFGTIVLQEGAPRSPTLNVPRYAGGAGGLAMPAFRLGAGTSLEIAAGPTVRPNGGIDRTGTVAVVEGNAELTFIKDDSMTLAREPDGRAFFFVEGGTLNFRTCRLDFGFNSSRFSEFRLDGGTVHLFSTNGMWWSLAVYGSRKGKNKDFSGGKHSTVILDNGSTFDITGRFALNNMKDDAGNPAVVFDLRDTNSLVRFYLAAESYFTDTNEVVSKGFGSIFISSTMGSENLYVTESNQWALVRVKAAADPAHRYRAWISGYSVGGRTGMREDPDGDGLDNLAEYALGGDPADPAVTGHAARWYKGSDNGTDYFFYVHAERNDAASRNLSYFVQQTTDPASGGWTTQGVEQVGRGPLDAEFDAVTNRIPLSGRSRFIRLHIRQKQ